MTTVISSFPVTTVTVYDNRDRDIVDCEVQIECFDIIQVNFCS
jgi:hypothetical protein